MKTYPCQPSAFSLVEITIALGVMSVSLLSIIGLLPVALGSNQKAVEQTVAANIAEAITSDLAMTSGTSTASQYFGLKFPATSGGSTLQNLFLAEDQSPIVNTGSASLNNFVSTTIIPSNARYRATVAITPGDPTQKQPTTARIMITWPALSDSNNLTNWPKNFIGSFETVVALNRAK